MEDAVGIKLFGVLVFEDEPFSRMYILGVKVEALPDLSLLKESELILRCLELGDGVVGSDKDKDSGDEGADWLKDDEGVWYMVIVDDIVPV